MVTWPSHCYDENPYHWKDGLDIEMDPQDSAEIRTIMDPSQGAAYGLSLW